MSTNIPNPYVGLRPFEMEEDLLFFGRDKQVLELLQRLHTHPFLAVVGGSGSGKSSLIRAGLIPALKGGYLVEDSSKWKIAIMKPGQHPMYNFGEALLRQIDTNVSSDQINKFLTAIKKEGIKAIIEKLSPLKETQRFNFFMLVDQFEELFRYQLKAGSSDQITEAIDFVNILLDLTSQGRFPFYIVLTMRSDFIGDCAQFHGLPEALNTCQYLVPRLNREEMKRVIEGPAKLYGKKFSPALTSKLLNDTTKVRDELPLLQHALMRIWDYEVEIDDSGELDLRDYKKIGTIHSALSQHADRALTGGDLGEKEAEMTSEEVALTKTIFKALTEIDDNGRKIRRPVLMSELKALTSVDEQRVLDILDRFIRNKRSFVYLQDVGDTRDKLIDISHESLIRQWKTLSRWVDEEGEMATGYKKLVEDTRLHSSNKKDLLSGSELQLALNWVDKFKPTALWAERYDGGFDKSMNYLEDSVAERSRLQEIEIKRKREERNKTRIAIGLLILIIVGGLFIFMVTNHNTTTRELQDKAQFLSASDPTSAMWLAEKALHRSDHGFFHLFYDEKQQSDIKNTAQTIYLNEAFYLRSIDVPSVVKTVAIAPEGDIFLSVTADSIARLWDMEGNIVAELKGNKRELLTAVFAENGKTILTATRENQIRLWDLQGNMIKEYSNLGAFYSLAFAPDGNTFLFNTWLNNTVHLMALDGTLIEQYQLGQTPRATALAMAPDGQSFLSASPPDPLDNKPGIIYRWDLAGNLITKFEAGFNTISMLAFAPDGSSILSAYEDDIVVTLWDIKGNWIRDFAGHEGSIYSVAFSPDGKSILTGSGDNTARWWGLNGTLLSELKGHKSGVTSIAFTPDGGSILTGSRDATIRIWPIKSPLIKEFEVPQENSTAFALAPDARSFISWSVEGSHSIGQWQDLEGNLLFEKLAHPDLVMATALALDGKLFLTGSWNYDGIIAQLWDKEGNKIGKPLAINGADIPRLVRIAPDGQTFLICSSDYLRYIVRLGNTEGHKILEFEMQGCKFKDAVFSPDGQLILFACEDGMARMWDINGQLIQSFSGHLDEVTSVAFAPDGQSILTGSRDNTAVLWPLDGSEITKISGHKNSVTAVAFSSNGQLLLTGSADKKIILWDLEGNALQEFKGHSKSIIDVAFSPDMKTILTASEDNTVRHWKITKSLEDFLETDWGQPLTADQKKDLGID